jgi:hypothetical protein
MLLLYSVLPALPMPAGTERARLPESLASGATFVIVPAFDLHCIKQLAVSVTVIYVVYRSIAYLSGPAPIACWVFF